MDDLIVHDEEHHIPDPCAKLRERVEYLEKDNAACKRMLERFLEASRKLLKDGDTEQLENLVEVMAMADLFIQQKNRERKREQKRNQR